MKPITTMLILGIAGLPISVLIAWLLSLINVPAWGQLVTIVVGVLICMFTGALCWSARMGEEMP